MGWVGGPWQWDAWSLSLSGRAADAGKDLSQMMVTRL
eukprot:CAMPEP_0184254156 /NCGR_PEP_ID=MMETSP0977-20130417/7198_1 /TAXON_ID=483370 /ORGANISM="non described non described, Strain CCMP2097" /LENGTH=36 /DNA_ID= /DNA_START= /DNA_END= /DNA_ORIENTATION=